jgi:hypothetical protein
MMCFFFFFALLGLELRVSRLLGEYCYCLSHSSNFFVMDFSEIGSHELFIRTIVVLISAS